MVGTLLSLKETVWTRVSSTIPVELDNRIRIDMYSKILPLFVIDRECVFNARLTENVG